MNEELVPEPDFSLSSHELTLSAVDQMQAAKTTIYAFPGFLEKWNESMAGQEGKSARGFISLACQTLDGREARIAYYRDPQLEQIEVRTLQRESRLPLPIIRNPYEREAIFIAINSSGSLENPTSLLHESSVFGRPAVTKFENSNTAVTKVQAALAGMLRVPTVLDEIDDVAAIQDMRNQVFDRARQIIDVPDDVESFEELVESIPDPVEKREPLTDDELDSFFAEARQQEMQEKLRADWTPGFIERWKMLFDGIE